MLQDLAAVIHSPAMLKPGQSQLNPNLIMQNNALCGLGVLGGIGVGLGSHQPAIFHTVNPQRELALPTLRDKWIVAGLAGLLTVAKIQLWALGV